MRKRSRDDPAHVEIAPTIGDRIERGIQFVRIEQSHQLQAGFLEIGKSLEIVRQVAAHLQDSDPVAFDLQGFG